MKTAISMPDAAAERMKSAAGRAGLNFSEFMTRAGLRYADTLEANTETERINAALASMPAVDASTEAAVEAGRKRAVSSEW